jgi:hypothetical protein
MASSPFAKLRQIDPSSGGSSPSTSKKRECAPSAFSPRAAEGVPGTILIRAPFRPCGAPRSGYQADVAERRRERELLLGRRRCVASLAARRNRPEMPGQCTAAVISSSLASTTCTSVDHPSDCTPETGAERRALLPSVDTQDRRPRT